MIALGCDHGGYALMKEVIAYLDANKIAYKNFGTFPRSLWIILCMQKQLHMLWQTENVKKAF